MKIPREEREKYVLYGREIAQFLAEAYLAGYYDGLETAAGKGKVK